MPAYKSFGVFILVRGLRIRQLAEKHAQLTCPERLAVSSVEPSRRVILAGSAMGKASGASPAIGGVPAKLPLWEISGVMPTSPSRFATGQAKGPFFFVPMG